MKKLFALLIALILGLFSTTVGTADNTVTVDRPTEAKYVEWYLGYHKSCRNYSRIAKQNVIHHNYTRMASRILLAPMTLLIGSASAASSEHQFRVSYIPEKDDVRTKTVNSFDEAVKLYNSVKQYAIKKNNKEMPRLLENISCSVPITLLSCNWTAKEIKEIKKSEWREDAIRRLKEAKIHQPQIDALMTMTVTDLKNAVATRSIDKLTEIKGIANKTARKAMFALKPICRPSIIKTIGSREFDRVRLVANTATYTVTDKIRKGVSPVEAKAIALGGDNALIHVVSYIEDAAENDIEDKARVEAMIDQWTKLVRGGIKLNGAVYVPLGHGTNSAKECKTIWVKQEIYAEMKAWIEKGVSKKWNTTPAKKLAYMVGLQSVTRKSCHIPFHPEDFAIFPSVFSNTHGKMVKEFLNGTEQKFDDHDEEVNRSDGYFLIDIPDKMIPEMINRMIFEQGMDPEDAAETLAAFTSDTSINSYRANGAALKGCGDKHVKVHKFAHDNGVTTTPDGRPIDSICVFVDETVIKTSIGENGAYATFEEWCNAVREELDLGICVKAHKKSKKDVSYQVVQSLAEASNETVKAMARKTIDRINEMHTVEGASHAMNREIGHIMRILPQLSNVRNVKERIEKRLTEAINDAFSGKLLRSSYYAFITPDPIYILQGWFGLEKTGCLDEGEFHVGHVRRGKLVFFRSPVMHPNSVRVINNVSIKKEYRKYFKSEEFVIMMNSKDDVSLAADADWDGDHGSISDDETLIKAAEETLAIWNRLVIWETPKTNKGEVTREVELEYLENLVHRNELGLTVYQLNALLNRVIKRKDEFTGEIYTEVIPVSERGVNFKKFAANVLVDASKHGGATIDEPEESAQSQDMIQPWAKTYRDAVTSKQLWRVYFKSVGETVYFATKEDAEKCVIDERERCKKIGEKCEVYGPYDHLAELSNKTKLNPKHKAGTLNRLFAEYAENIDRSTKLYDAPDADDKFDVRWLMLSPEKSRRGLSGLISQGVMPLVEVDGEKLRPDQGLFDAIARRMDKDRAEYSRDDSRKDMEDTSFEDAWRTTCLAEIQAFAESMGKTLEDAYDVITWQMFTFIDKQYTLMDHSMDFIRDRMWSAYWTIFGGMAEEAAERWEESGARRFWNDDAQPVDITPKTEAC